jgi:chromosome segregation ATPase
MNPAELLEAKKELKKLEARAEELLSWLYSNTISTRFSEVNSTYNEINIKIANLRERIENDNSKTKQPESEWTGSIPRRPNGFRTFN